MNSRFRLPPLPTIKELLKLYNVRALKKLSQNFLLDLKITDKIVRVAKDITISEVCEIGPGPGGITRSILSYVPNRVVVIEKDIRFKPILESLAESVNCSKIDIIFGDIMGFNMSQLFSSSLKKDWEDKPPNIHLIGNLPFSVSTPLIIQWMRDISLHQNAWSYGRVTMTLTFQEEVAERIVAPILSKKRCRMSVMCQNWCKVNHKFTIPGKAFLPKPDVNVGVVHLEPLVKPIIDLDFYLIEKVLRVTFNGRQKYGFNSIQKLFPEEVRVNLTKEMFEKAELSQEIKPYQITNEEFGRLCYAYKSICDKDPRLYLYNHRGPRKKREEDWKNEQNLDSENTDLEFSQTLRFS